MRIVPPTSNSSNIMIRPHWEVAGIGLGLISHDGQFRGIAVQNIDEYTETDDTLEQSFVNAKISGYFYDTSSSARRYF